MFHKIVIDALSPLVVVAASFPWQDKRINFPPNSIQKSVDEKAIPNSIQKCRPKSKLGDTHHQAFQDERHTIFLRLYYKTRDYQT